MTPWAALVVAIILIFIIAVTIANIVYYFDVRNGKCTAVSANTATTMMILNIIILIAAAIILVWMLWLFFRRPDQVIAMVPVPAPAPGVAKPQPVPAPAPVPTVPVQSPSTSPEQVRQEQLISSASAF